MIIIIIKIAVVLAVYSSIVTSIWYHQHKRQSFCFKSEIGSLEFFPKKREIRGKETMNLKVLALILLLLLKLVVLDGCMPQNTKNEVSIDSDTYVCMTLSPIIPGN